MPRVLTCLLRTDRAIAVDIVQFAEEQHQALLGESDHLLDLQQADQRARILPCGIRGWSGTRAFVSTYGKLRNLKILGLAQTHSCASSILFNKLNARAPKSLLNCFHGFGGNSSTALFEVDNC